MQRYSNTWLSSSQIFKWFNQGKKRENILLATEWNHIEAGLSYARNLPLLVIHHKNVIRGIFDHGSLNSFIHEFDLANDSWSSNPKMTEILKKWRDECLVRDKEEKRKIKELERINKVESGAKVTVKFVRKPRISSRGTSYKICIVNEGPEDAENVNISFPEDNDPIIKSEYSKLPIQSLPIGIEFKLISTGITTGISPPFNAKLEWEDSTGDNSKVFPLT